MADEQVEYELNLKDNLSGKIDEAEHHVNKLEHTMEGLKEKILSIGETLGISFAFFELKEFIHEGVEQMEKMHLAEAQLANTMQNMGNYSEESFEKLVKGAEEAQHHINFTTADILQLQSQLKLVGNISEDQMEKMTQVSADIASKMHIGLDEAGNLLSRSINAPEMARRLGMALKIDPRVMEHISNLAHHAHEAEARMLLLEVAESKVGGAAEAAFNADPLARYNKSLLELKEMAGTAAIEFMKILAPALEWVVDTIKDMSHWIKDNWNTIKEWGEVLAALIGPMALVAGGTWALSVASGALAGALDLVAGAMDLIAANPIGLAIGIVAAIVVYCYKHFAIFREVLWGVWATIKEWGSLVSETFQGLWHIIHGIFTFNASEIKLGGQEELDVLNTAGKRMGGAFKKGFDEAKAEDDKAEGDSLVKPPNLNSKPKKFAMDPVKEPKTKATGSRVVTINVTIHELIDKFETHVSNIQESNAELRRIVVQTLTEAVNDFQIVGDH